MRYGGDLYEIAALVNSLGLSPNSKLNAMTGEIFKKRFVANWRVAAYTVLISISEGVQWNLISPN